MTASGWHRKRTTPADLIRARQYASREHKQLRARIQTSIDHGALVTCWRCGTRLYGRAWHLGHDDHDRTIYRGAECIRCNRTAAAKAGARIANARRKTRRAQSRIW